MYEELFHSTVRPFRATPDAKFYYPFESIENARQTIIRATLRAEGPVMVLGGAGLGKSLLSLVVADDLAARFDIVRLQSARLSSRRSLLQNILFELHMPYRDMSEGELRLSILDRMEPSSQHAPDGILIVVDEAHTLSPKLLEELRLITNFTRDNQPRARLVLIGNLRLEETFTEPLMESFNQRLAARCYLQPMNRQQTCEFVNHQLQAANVTPSEVITPEAINTVYAASEGVPRLSNQIMDHALVLGITRSQCPISSALIEEAWADLQQLPAPWHTGATAFEPPAPRAENIEFGELQDDLQDDEEATGEHRQAVNLFIDIDADETHQPSATDDEPSWESASQVGEFTDADDVDADATFTSYEPPTTTKLPDPQLLKNQQSDSASTEVPPIESSLQDPQATTRASALVGPQNCLPECDTACDRNCTSVCERAANAEKFSHAESVTLDCQEFSLAEDAEFETKKSNFFAAFSPAEDAALSEASAEQDSSRVAESAVPTETELVRPTVVFDASLAFTATGSGESEAGKRLKSDSFFADRPTDEQLLAFEDEQAQYDSLEVRLGDADLNMGVWENDPPLQELSPTDSRSDADTAVGSIAETAESLEAELDVSEQNEPTIQKVTGGPTRAQLFGEDFEDEIPIGSSANEPNLTTGFVQETEALAETDAVSRERQAAEAADYVARIQAYADAVGQSEDEPVVVDDVLESERATGESTASEVSPVDFDVDSIVDGWSVDVATLDASDELAVHSEIEDLVSQLNFAAFSVEPYSVEQIAIESQNQHPVPPIDSVRTGENDEIYTLHRGQSTDSGSENLFSEMGMSYDDDRDLLVVEEDLPARSAGNAAATTDEKPATKIAPYSQLFAKLRK